MTAVPGRVTMIPLRELAGKFAGTLLSGVACGAVGWFPSLIGRG